MGKSEHMYLRNTWYCAAETKELGHEPLGRVFLNEPVVLYRKADGAPIAFEDRCCHRRAPLSKGKVEGDGLRCGYHGFLYDATGACVWAPGQTHVPPDARVRAYPLCERHGFIWIWMGEPARADVSTVPDFHWNHDPAWAPTGGHLSVDCNYLLLVDNLMDLSHVPVLHIETIGSVEDTEPDLAWERGPNFVRGTRFATDRSVSARMRSEGIDCNIDQTKIMTYTPPANVVIDIATTETGVAPGAVAKLNHRMIILDAMTPETETSCHYFWAACRNMRIDDDALTASLHRQIVIAFNEDKDMLEGEQRIIDFAPAAPQVDVKGDAGGLQSRRLLDEMIAAESAERAAAAE